MLLNDDEIKAIDPDGLAEGFAGVEIPVEQCVAEGLEGDPGGLEDGPRPSPARQGDGSVHVVGAARQRPQNAPRIVAVGRLAVHHTVEFDTRVGTQHDCSGMPRENDQRFFCAQAPHVVDGRFTGSHRLVDVGGVDDGVAPAALQQVDAPRRP